VLETEEAEEETEAECATLEDVEDDEEG
jgi:hypothetical protein